MLVFFFPLKTYAQKDVVEIRAVDSTKAPITLIRLNQYEIKSVCSVLSRIFYNEPPPTLPSPALPWRFVKLTSEQARNFSPEKLSALGVYSQTVNIFGMRLSTTPQENVTLLDSEKDLKKVSFLREYWQQVWGIAPERIQMKYKVELARAGRCVEIVASPALMEPVVVSEIHREVQPSEIVFASTVTNPETPVQWTIAVMQRTGIGAGSKDHVVKNITTIGKVRPLVAWKMANEIASLAQIDTVPLVYQLSVRYDGGSPNRKSERGSIPVQGLLQPKTRKDRYLLLLGANDAKALTAQNKTMVERIKREKLIQSASTVTVKYFSNNAANPDAERGAQAVVKALDVGKNQLVIMKNKSPEPHETFMVEGDVVGVVVTIIVETPIEKK